MLLTQEQSISKQLKVLPQRFTASDRIQNFSREKSSLLIGNLTKNASEFLSQLSCETNYGVDTTDGLRIILDNSDVIHLRPSGNAPELRCYVESNTHTKAVKVVKDVLSLIAQK
jgi:phosphomannomutase